MRDEPLIETRYRVVMPEHRTIADSAVCKVQWPREPGYQRLSSLVCALVDGNLEHVTALSDFDGGSNFNRSDVFVNEDGHSIGLPRNEVATTIYRRATLCGRSGAPMPADPEVLPFIVGPMVLFSRRVWF
jgi:hypothetical protein